MICKKDPELVILNLPNNAMLYDEISGEFSKNSSRHPEIKWNIDNIIWSRYLEKFDIFDFRLYERYPDNNWNYYVAQIYFLQKSYSKIPKKLEYRIFNLS